MEIITIHWNIDLACTEDGLKPDPPEVVNVLPGDTIVFTGATATVTFPPGLTEPLSGPAPGAFKVHPSARDGRFAYRIDGASEEAGSASPSVKIGLAF